MPETTTSFIAPDFLALTVGIVVFFVGVLITQRVSFLRTYNIPEPVTGGFVAAVAFWAVYEIFGLAIGFDMATRDRLLVIFFATVGVNARLSDLAAGGRVLAKLCLITVAFVFLQNGVGTIGALTFGLPRSAGVVVGSVALVGGHGTAIAWGPAIAADHGFPAALEMGIAVATLGLIIASLLGGPIAKLLIERKGLTPSAEDSPDGGLPPEADTAPIDKMGIMRAMLVVNVAVILGYLVHDWISSLGSITLPLFVPCLIMGIVLSNTIPILFPILKWPARTASLELISSYALSIFLAMSLMSMQLWTLAGVAGPLLVIVAVQTVVALAYILLVVFPTLGRDYQAAVLSGGFTGLSLGSTPTAIASMSAITRNYGPAPNAFIILPLVSAFFVDLVNMGVITLFLRL
jgi:ESS family glutamate:Na+ symporter